MSREEQINLYLKGRNIPITSLEANSIIEGIKWADEHPNLYNDEKYHTVKVSCLDELYRKSELYDTLLEKVCKYLKSLVFQEFASGPLERTFSDEDIENFIKAMEE